jgi:hypothetical protein
MARHRPEKKREPQAAADIRILPMELQIGDRLADETGEWEVKGRPYSSSAGKIAEGPTTADPRPRRISAASCSQVEQPLAGARSSARAAAESSVQSRTSRLLRSNRGGRAMLGFILGAIAGAVAAYCYRDNIKSYMNEKTPTVRDRAADKLEAFGKGAEDVLDRAKSRIGSTVRAGQERLRSVGGSGPTTD